MAHDPSDPGWKWFPSVKNDWRLDVVTLLAVIGESSMAEHSQAITASLLCVLPRLIPAPQALLKPSRPTRLPETHAKMTGVYSGTTLDSVGFFANIILPLDTLPAFSFRILDIKHSNKPPRALSYSSHRSNSGNWFPRLFRSARPSSGGSIPGPPPDEESAPGLLAHGNRTPTVHFASESADKELNNKETDKGRALRRRFTTKEDIQDILAVRTMAVTDTRPIVPPKLFSPIHILSVFSCALSIAILIAAVFWEDGAAIIAVVLISSASSVVGYASSWKPILMQRRHTNKVPRGDVMIRTREGAFLLVRCSEEVARELYSGTEECEYYVGERTYRMLMALGTVVLMLSVVLLGNCTWNSQIFIGGSYIVLNGLYWGMGMIPRAYFWDMTRYEWADREGHPSYTRSLWYAIRETKTIGWVERSGSAPGTEQWKQWLKEALSSARKGDRQWKAVERKNAIMSPTENEEEEIDEAEQHAPATEVQAVAVQPPNTTF
ncbi:hypothetical protein PT974_01930 [Cladobotryum mycophilum]|uniref:Uncharacterized protein n=1 Tax=Cladobotryum mycophilum TaxID=491253 RepID=A0ABR0SWR3_9HYPO